MLPMVLAIKSLPPPAEDWQMKSIGLSGFHVGAVEDASADAAEDADEGAAPPADDDAAEGAGVEFEHPDTARIIAVARITVDTLFIFKTSI